MRTVREPRRGVSSAARTALAAAVLLLAAPVTAAHADTYEPTGTRIAGGEDPGTATPLAPGTWLDSLPPVTDAQAGTGSVRYYRISVRTGETPFVAATLVPPASPEDGTSLSVAVSMSPDGGDGSCSVSPASDSRSVLYGTLQPVTAVLTPGPIGAEDSCLPAGGVVVKVERTGDAGAGTALPVELAYRLEPAAAGTGLPRAATTGSPAERVDLAGVGATVRTGSSFETAPRLQTGIYRSSLTAGDVRYVRVHLDWGQRFAYSFSAGDRGADYGDSFSAGVTVVDPLRRPAAQSGYARASVSGIGAGDTAMFGSTLVPVRWNNRTSEDDDIARYATAGDWYLVLASSRPSGDGASALTVPYTLKIQVSGAAQRGPVYAGTATPPRADSPDGGATRTVVAAVAGAVVVLGSLALVVLWRRRSGVRAAGSA